MRFGLASTSLCAAAYLASTISARTPHTRSFFYVGEHYETRGAANIARGQMYVEHLMPLRVQQPYPLLFIPGQGMTGTNFLNTPDGQPGWVDFFLAEGYEIYIVDPPSRGRSPWQKDVDGLQTVFDSRRIEERFTATSIYNLWPQASLHTQWPGNGSTGDAAFDNFYTSIVPHLQSNVEAAEKLKRAGSVLLDRIGGAALVTHSHSGQYGWILADARPGNVKAIVALEPLGPPFIEAVFTPLTNARPYGLTDIPLEYDPPIADASDLKVEATSNALLVCYRQADPPRKLKNLVGIPVLILTSESGYHAIYDHCTAEYLGQAGVKVEHIRLEEVGIHGNGHMMFMEKNNLNIAQSVIQPWLARQTSALPTPSTVSPLSMRRNQEDFSEFIATHSEL